jgi:quinol monooxygenase YgiN
MISFPTLFGRDSLRHRFPRRDPADCRDVASPLRVLRRFARAFVPLAIILAVAAPSPAARAQADAQAGSQPAAEAIYGVTSLDVAPGAVSEGIALLKQYRDAALKQAGNFGVVLLQEADWPNRFVVYESWKDQPAYDANEKAAHTVELRDRLKSISSGPLDRRDYRIVSVAPPRPATGPDTVYMQLHLDVFPPALDKTVEAAKQVAEAARKVDGNLRYDVVRSARPSGNHQTLLAAWENRKAFDDYEISADTRRFRDTVGPLLGSPFDDRLYVPIN